MSPQEDITESREPRWWVEMTRVKGRPHRRSGDYAVGGALTSPRRDKGGKDIYTSMRQVRDGDICIHLTDRTAITGISRIAGACEEFSPSQVGLDLEEVLIPSDEGYLVRLHGYQALNPPLQHSEIIKEEFRERLLAVHKTDHVFYDQNLQLKQGGFLTSAPPELIDVLDEAYRKVSGQTLREVVGEDGAMAPSARWDTFIEWARRFYEWERFDEEERDYKLEIAANLKAAKDSLLESSPDWGEKLEAAFGPPNNLVYWYDRSAFLKLLDSNREGFESTLRRFWEVETDVSPEERVRGFADGVASLGFRLMPDTLASFLLMADDGTQYPIYRATPYKDAYRLTGSASPRRGTKSWDRYGYALSFVDEFIQRAAASGLRIQDRLDAQSLIWCVTSKTPEEWPQRVTDAHDAYRKDGATPPPGPEPPPGHPSEPVNTGSTDPWTADKVAELAKELLWEPVHLQKIIDGLQDKRQVIFQGPPGTGKTYVAKRIAEWCKEHGGDYRIVQFHPSYAYEDFIEGFRPRLTEGGQAGFTLTEGPLRRIAEQARAKPDATFILVIDEINRGNLSKVLGELYFLLEYRDEKVALQYSNEPFSLPKNLWFIGTMNTTDRSIALVDAALRRRFYFFNFFPDKPPIKNLLRDWVAENKPEAKWVADLVDLANRKLEDRHLGIGPSYFMKNTPQLNEHRVRFIWEQAVIPYIEEQCFGDEARLEAFDFDRLMGELDGTSAEPAAGNAGTDGAAGEENEQSEQAGE